MSTQKENKPKTFDHVDDPSVYLNNEEFEKRFNNTDALFDGEEVEFISIAFFLNGVKYDSLEEYLGLQKCNPDYSFEEFKKDLCMYIEYEGETIVNPFAPPEDTARRIYDSVEPFTARDVFTRYGDNAEKRMVAISFLGAEEIHKAMNAQLVDEQIVKKTQKKHIMKRKDLDEHNLKLEDISSSNIDDLLEEQIINREETYKLYKIPKDEFNKMLDEDSEDRGRLDEDVYYLQVSCPSTDRQYFMYVDPTDERCTSNALSAIAWTFRDESGERLTPEQYLELEQET